MTKRTTKVREVEYWITPESGTTAQQILQVRDFTPGSVTRPTEDETCHEDANAQTSLGTPTYGPASITVLFDPTDAVHLRLRDLALTASDPIYLVKGYSNGGVAPTITDIADGFVFPDSRSWMQIQGTVTNWREAGAIGQNTTWQFDIQPTGDEPVVTEDKVAFAISGTAPDGAETVVYGAFSYSVVGDVAPVTYSISVGVLPTGLSINASTGAVTGTPTTAGTYAYTVRCVDAEGQVATLEDSVTITA